jgi:WbqC-like protein
MILAIRQPHYLPWMRYMHKTASCDVFVFLDDVLWQNALFPLVHPGLEQILATPLG